MERKGRPPGDFQPLLLVLLVIAVVVAALGGIHVLGRGYLKTAEGEWADGIDQAEVLVQSGTQTRETDGTSRTETAQESLNPTEEGKNAQTELPSSENAESEQAETEGSQTETEGREDAVIQTEEIPAENPTEAAMAQTESEAVYLILQVSCNFRAGPSMEAEIYGTREAGTTVRFIEDVGGWYHVEIDGIEGYMGSQFF